MTPMSSPLHPSETTNPDQPFLSLITGSFSTPAGGNPTVAMVEAAYRDLGLAARYVNCEVSTSALADAVRGAAAMGWAGFNCSLPHKVAVIEHLDDLSPAARIIGAVNCVVIRHGRLTGENTDGKGFVEALRRAQDPAGASMVVLGAGGAARAIAVESALAGAATVTIVARHLAAASALAHRVAEQTGAATSALPWEPGMPVPAADILVNATSVGMHPDGEAVVDIDLDSLDPATLVADVIANPPRSRLIREAELRGCRTIDGLGMLVAQAVVAIELWTGCTPDPAVMRTELERIFSV
ncbi:MAG: shikimate dehydrogenase [Lapillicoccus sp.]